MELVKFENLQISTPLSIPDYFKSILIRYLDKKDYEGEDIEFINIAFDPVHALMIEQMVIDKHGQNFWNNKIMSLSPKDQGVLCFFLKLSKLFIFTSNKKRNLVFTKNVWNIYETDSKFRIYINGLLEDAGSSFSFSDLKPYLVSDIINEIVDTKNIIAFRDGVIDINKFEERVRKGRPCDFLTVRVEYNINFESEEIRENELQTLLQMLFPDKELLEYFLYHMASCLDSGNLDKLFVIWFGLGSNGKSVMETLVEHTFGNYCYKAPTSMFSSRRGNSSGATPELMSLSKSLVTFLQESDSREDINIGVLKEMTGNDTIYVRGLYENSRTITVRSKFVLVTNKVYNLTQADEATWARIRVIPFLSKFVNSKELVNKEKNIYMIDPRFIKDVKKLAPYFMKLLLKYYEEYRYSGMPSSKAVDEHTSNLRKANSPVSLFIEDELVESVESSVMFQEAYESYRLFARKNCGLRTITASDFISGLKRLDIVVIDGTIVGYYLKNNKGF